MRYILLDRVTRIERGKRVAAFKNTSLAEDVFADHFIGFPVMPGALLIESAAQAGSVLIEASTDFKKKALLMMIEHAKFRAMVRPGDQLTVTVEVEAWEKDHVRAKAAIQVKDRSVMDGRLVFALKDVENFYPSKTRHLVESVYGILLEGAERVGFSEDDADRARS